MSEQDMHKEPEEGAEDVEAHLNKGSHVSRNIAKDDDVEGHTQKGHVKSHVKGHEDDDVEGHIFKQSHKPSHKP